jgi:hypothetical protein
MASSGADSDTAERYCQAHDSTPAVARLTSTSAAGTPLVLDVCAECLRNDLEGFQMFGAPPGTEIEWFDDSAKENIDDELLKEVEG